MAETSDSEEELFLTQSSFSNGSSNWGNEFEEFVCSNNRQVDHDNAQFNVEEARVLFWKNQKGKELS